MVKEVECKGRSRTRRRGRGNAMYQVYYAFEENGVY